MFLGLIFLYDLFLIGVRMVAMKPGGNAFAYLKRPKKRFDEENIRQNERIHQTLNTDKQAFLFMHLLLSVVKRC